MAKKNDLYDQTIKQFKRGQERGSGIPSMIFDVIVHHYGEDYRPIIIEKYLIPPKDISDKPKTTTIPRSLKEAIRRAKGNTDTEDETWSFCINLPAGHNFENFKKLEQTFADALGEDGTCQIEQKGKAVHMTVSNVDHKKAYPYEFDPKPYMKGKKPMLLPFPVGYSINGLIVKDLAEMLTCLIVGMMGSGKSNIEHVMNYTLLSLNRIDKSPHVIPVILDPKLGEFRYFENYGALWAKEPSDIEKLLRWVNSENDRRAKIIGPTGARNFPEFLKLGHKMPSIVLFCDEMGELTKSAYASFHRLLHQGRSQGIFTVGAIQRPSSGALGAIGSFPELKAMFDANIVYRVKDAINSNMILQNSKAAFLPKKSPGRCIFSWDEEIECQSMYFPSIVSDPDRYHELLSKLPQFAQPYENIQGEVHDYEQREQRNPSKVLLPRYTSSGSPRALQMLKHGTNPFA